MARVGRPSKYTPELASRICEELIEGKSLRSICKEDWCPAITNVIKWLVHNDEFRAQYTQAREAQAELMAHDIIELADTCREGVKTRVTDKGTETITGDMVERSKLQVDARKWVAARLLPKKYGDSVKVGDLDGNPLGFFVSFVNAGDQATTKTG